MLSVFKYLACKSLNLILDNLYLHMISHYFAGWYDKPFDATAPTTSTIGADKKGRSTPDLTAAHSNFISSLKSSPPTATHFPKEEGGVYMMTRDAWDILIWQHNWMYARKSFQTLFPKTLPQFRDFPLENQSLCKECPHSFDMPPLVGFSGSSRCLLLPSTTITCSNIDIFKH
jgi:hypothetical protein